jgi:hypothetical protein
VRLYPRDRWDPLRKGVGGFRYFGREEAERCVRGKRIHLAGDSTTRDTFYEFAAAAGHPMFTDRAMGIWKDGAYEPTVRGQVTAAQGAPARRLTGPVVCRARSPRSPRAARIGPASASATTTGRSFACVTSGTRSRAGRRRASPSNS